MEYANDGAAQPAYVTNATETSNVAVGGTPTASSILQAGFEADKAFDQNTATRWINDNSGAPLPGTPAWLKYQLTSGKIATSYTIQNRTDGLQFPVDWIFQGSTNDSTWTDLDTRTAVTSWTNGEIKTFTFSNTTSYTYYRIYITKAENNAATVAITEVTIIVPAPSLQSYSEATIKTQGSYALKAVATTGALNKTLTHTFATNSNLTGVKNLRFDAYASRTGAQWKLGIHDTGGTTTEITPTIATSNTWQPNNWDLSAVSDANKDNIDTLTFTITNADDANTVYLDYAEIAQAIDVWGWVN